MKSRIFLVLIFLFIAIKADAVEICMTEDVAKEVVIELEKCRITEAQVVDYEEAINNLNEQIKKHEEVINAQSKALEEADKIILEKDALIEKAKNSCPKVLFTHEVLKALGFIGIGLLLGVML